MHEAFVLLNVDFKKQKDVIESAKKIPVVKSIKTVYGMYDLMVVIESSNTQEIKSAIDVELRKIEGINNLTPLISIN